MRNSSEVVEVKLEPERVSEQVGSVFLDLGLRQRCGKFGGMMKIQAGVG